MQNTNVFSRGFDTDMEPFQNCTEQNVFYFILFYMTPSFTFAVCYCPILCCKVLWHYPMIIFRQVTSLDHQIRVLKKHGTQQNKIQRRRNGTLPLAALRWCLIIHVVYKYYQELSLSSGSLGWASLWRNISTKQTDLSSSPHAHLTNVTPLIDTSN